MAKKKAQQLPPGWDVFYIRFEDPDGGELGRLRVAAPGPVEAILTAAEAAPDGTAGMWAVCGPLVVGASWEDIDRWEAIRQAIVERRRRESLDRYLGLDPDPEGGGGGA